MVSFGSYLIKLTIEIIKTLAVVVKLSETTIFRLFSNLQII